VDQRLPVQMRVDVDCLSAAPRPRWDCRAPANAVEGLERRAIRMQARA